MLDICLDNIVIPTQHNSKHFSQLTQYKFIPSFVLKTMFKTYVFEVSSMLKMLWY